MIVSWRKAFTIGGAAEPVAAHSVRAHTVHCAVGSGRFHVAQPALSERRINMSVILAMHEIAHSRRMKGPIIQYRVGGLPTGETAFITNFGRGHEDSWRIFHTKSGIDAHWQGDFKTADDALAALQNEY